MMSRFLTFEWIADRERPENFNKIEQIVLNYTINFLDTSGFIYSDHSQNSVEIIEDSWIRKIAEELKKKVAGDTRALLDGETATRLGTVMMNSLLLKHLHKDILRYNNSKTGHIFDLFINFYLCFVLVPFKANNSRNII
jgi:hypothetical protein